MTLVGFKRMTIQVFDKAGKPVVDQKFVIEGKADEGATVTADISGLSKDPEVVDGSDIAYYISRKGVGEVKADFGLLDVPVEVSDVILGYRKSTEGITYIGSKTEAPYCAILMESTNTKGEKALLGMFKGTFSREKIHLESLKSKEAFKPEAEAYVFTAIASDADDKDINGEYVGKYYGDETTAIEKLTTQVLGSANFKPAVDVKSVTLDKTTATVAVGETITLTATVAPDNATNKTVTFDSSDKTIATVDSKGAITGIKKTAEGQTIDITATAGGKSATCKLTVN